MEINKEAAMQATNNIPTMPRAMKSPAAAARNNDPGFDMAAINTSLYKKLLLLQCISNYTDPKETNSNVHQQNLDPQELRRAFTNQISYLCDWSKDGTTVTAAFLQKGQRGHRILRVAANEGVNSKVRDFLEWVVRDKLKNTTKESHEHIEKAILAKAVALAPERLEFYKYQMLHFAGKCLDQLRNGTESSLDTPKLKSWIEDLKRPHWHNKLSTMCYQARGAGHWQSLIAANTKAPNDCFADFSHYIGRIGAHLFAVKTIVLAALKVPAIKAITDVEFEVCPKPQVFKIDLGFPGPYEIVRTILNSNKELDRSIKLQMMQSFVTMDLDQDITTRFRSTGTTMKPIKTVVHAELQLYNLASRRRMQFADGDCYVGCSKPACYFCKTYQMSHPKSFVPPPSHHKVLLNVRAPDADPKLDVSGKGAALLKKAQENMEWKVDQDILQALDSASTPISFQHCSTDGVGRAFSIVTTQFG